LQCNSSRSFLHLDAGGFDKLAPLFAVAAHAPASFFMNVSSLCRAMQFSFFAARAIVSELTGSTSHRAKRIMAPSRT
jgi:hypothetical protein